MKIVALESTNVKRLRAVSITPTGHLVQITGGNAAGKTSVLDSIFYALAGKRAMPAKPVRRGEQAAVIALDLGDVRVVRKITADGKTEVIVEAVSGARFPSPQRMLDELLGELTFDPLKFSLAEPRAQLDTLRSLTKLDVDLDALDRANEKDYVLRADWNRRAKSMTERVRQVAEGVTDADITPIDIAGLTTQMVEASAHNAAFERAQHELETNRQRVAELQQNSSDIQEQIERLQRSLTNNHAALKQALHVVNEWVAPASPIDVRQLSQQINDATMENVRRENQARRRAAVETATADLTQCERTAAELTAAMKARVEQKAAAVAAATMPVDGLSFGDGMVLYHGVPLDQASSAEQLRVSFAVAMAINPKLKIVLIRDGSLLDPDNLALVASMAEAHDYQVWLERVDVTGKVGIVIEDGEVRAIDGVPVGEHHEVAG